VYNHSSLTATKGRKALQRSRITLMTDQFDPEMRSWIMGQVKSKNTAPERTVRSIAHSMGYRFRLHRKDLPGSPDIVFPSRHKVVFVNGCFWHGHRCRRAKLPESRRGYWQTKISKTKARDRNHLRLLRANAWDALVIWECQLKDIDDLRRRIVKFLGRATARPMPSHSRRRTGARRTQATKQHSAQTSARLPSSPP
jgi:DNA mismatch endonuclease, patch repair protein